MWQYTSCGIATKYGVPGTRVDLNLFRGNAQAFIDLIQGSWTPSLVDLMPSNEATVLTILAQSITTSNNISFKIAVSRPDLSPVVTGTVKLVLDELTSPPIKTTQSVIRATSGEWSLSVKGLPAGHYSGKIQFIDVSQTHATSFQAVTFDVVQATSPTPSSTSSPTSTPTQKPTPKPSVDGCAHQIKN